MKSKRLNYIHMESEGFDVQTGFDGRRSMLGTLAEG